MLLLASFRRGAFGSIEFSIVTDFFSKLEFFFPTKTSDGVGAINKTYRFF
jgi:hypothetical protein